MITKHSNQIEQMIRDAAEMAIERAKRLEKCGGIDINSPHYCKAIVCVALRSIADDYGPNTPEQRADVFNLECF